MTTVSVDSATRLPRDANAEAMQAGGSDGIEKVDVTAGAVVSVDVPEGALEARLWGTGDGDDTLQTFYYGGSGTGFKDIDNAAPVPTTMQPFVASVATASVIGVGGSAAGDVWIQWVFGSDDDAKPTSA